MLIVAKINNSTMFEDSNSMKKKVFALRKKGENIGAHIKTIKSYQLAVKRLLERILAGIPVEMHSIELRLILQMRHNMGTR